MGAHDAIGIVAIDVGLCMADAQGLQVLGNVEHPEFILVDDALPEVEVVPKNEVAAHQLVPHRRVQRAVEACALYPDGIIVVFLLDAWRKRDIGIGGKRVALHHFHARMPHGHLAELLNAVGRDAVVAVEKEEVVAGGVSDAGIASGGDPTVVVVGNNLEVYIAMIISG